MQIDLKYGNSPASRGVITALLLIVLMLNLSVQAENRRPSRVAACSNTACMGSPETESLAPSATSDSTCTDNCCGDDCCDEDCACGQFGQDSPGQSLLSVAHAHCALPSARLAESPVLTLLQGSVRTPQLPPRV